MSELQSILEKTGRFPPLTIRITPLDKSLPTITLNDFVEYTFDSSVIVPCDQFSFTFIAPDDLAPYQNYFQEGDMIRLYAGSGKNEQPLATGIIDIVESETEADYGEKIVVRGRNLMQQFEDHDAISVDSTPIYGNLMTVDAVCNRLRAHTRIPGQRKQQAPKKAYLFATEPGESKLAALCRYLDPLNCLCWMDPDGTLVVGRPNMSQPSLGDFYMDKRNRTSNVISMKSVSAAATVANVIVPVWVGQENVQFRVAPQQGLVNMAPGPNRLHRLGHIIPKAIVVSNPTGESAQEKAEISRIRAGNGNLLQAYGKRELARQNFKEKTVQVIRAGHYNDDATPYKKDTVYNVYYDRAQLHENMYCYQVQYTLTPRGGQRTSLFFTRFGTLVGDILAP